MSVGGIGTELIFRLRADSSQGKAAIENMTSALKRMGLETDKTGAKTEALGQKVSLIDFSGLAMKAKIAAAAVPVALGAIGIAAIKMAMDAVESENLFAVSMGRMADEADAWSKDLSKSLGLNQFEIRKQVAMLNTMFVSMSLGVPKAYDLSKGLTQLAYDMASFYNLDPTEAFDKLRSGITGEAEPLKRLGILVNEQTIKTYAYQHGIAQLGEELTEQEKVLARYGSIMEQTAMAQGDLARTITSPANALRVLKARSEELMTTLGTAFLPLLSTAASALGEILKIVNLNGDAMHTLALAITAPVNAYLEYCSGMQQAIIKSNQFVQTILEMALVMDMMASKINPLYVSQARFLNYLLVSVKTAEKEHREVMLGILRTQLTLAQSVAQVGKQSNYLMKTILDLQQVGGGGVFEPMVEDIKESRQQTEAEITKIKQAIEKANRIGESWNLDWAKKGQEEIDRLQKETDDLIASFEKALRPADALEMQLQTLLEHGFSKAQIVATWGEQIRTVGNEHERLNKELPLSITIMRALAAEAKILGTKPPQIYDPKWIKDFIRDFPEIDKQVKDLNKKTKKSAEDWGTVWTNQISTVFTDMSKGIADAIVDWKGFGKTLLATTKEFAKGMIRTMIEQLLDPMKGVFSQIGKGLAGIFKGQGLSGFGGLSSVRSLFGGASIPAAGGAQASGSWITSANAIAALATAATASIVAVVKLTKSEFDKMRSEFARDFGEIWIPERKFKQFFQTATSKRGPLSQAQMEPIRKDLMASPQFLVDIALPIAQAQGQLKAFLESLEQVKTSWGTFNFREAFEFGMETGNWERLNEAYRDAFEHSLALKDVISDLKQLFADTPPFIKQVTTGLDLLTAANKRYLVLAKDIERSLAAGEETYRTVPDYSRPKTFAPGYYDDMGNWHQGEAIDWYNTLSDEHQHYLDKLKELRTMLEQTGQSVRDFTATGKSGQETTIAFAEAIRQAAQIASALGAALPASITPEMVRLAEAMGKASGDSTRYLKSWIDLKNGAKQLSDEIYTLGTALWDEMGPAMAQQKGWKLIKADVISTASAYRELGLTLPPLIQQTVDWAIATGRLTDTLQEVNSQGLVNSWNALKQAGWDLNAQIIELHKSLVAEVGWERANKITLDMSIASVVELATQYREYGMILPPVIQNTLDYAKSLGIINDALEFVGETIDTVVEKPLLLQQWDDLRNAGSDLSQQAYELGLALQAAFPTDNLTAQKVQWELVGSAVQTLYEQYTRLGFKIPSLIQSIYDFGVAQGYVRQEVEEVAEEVIPRAIQQWRDYGKMGADLESQLRGLQDEIGQTRSPTDTIRMSWAMLGDEIEEFLAIAREYYVQVPAFIQQTRDWIIANGALGESYDSIRAISDRRISAAELNSEIAALQSYLVNSGVESQTVMRRTWAELGDEILQTIDTARIFGDAIPPIVQGLYSWIIANGELAASVDAAAPLDVIRQWRGMGDIGNTLAAQITALNNTVLRSNDPMQTMRVVWSLLGDDIEAFIENARRYGFAIPEVVAGTYAWIRANGELADSYASIQSWRDVQKLGGDLAIEWLQLQSELVKTKSSQDAMRIGWDLLGDRITSIIEQYTKYGLVIPDIIQSTYDWIQANGALQGSLDESSSEAFKARKELYQLATAYLQTGEVSERLAEMIQQYGGQSTWNQFMGAAMAGLPIDQIIETLANWIPSRVPSYDVGTDYVPRNTLAMVHKGEQIIPAGQRGEQTIVVTFNGPVYGFDDFERKVSDAVTFAYRRGGLRYLGTN